MKNKKILMILCIILLIVCTIIGTLIITSNKNNNSKMSSDKLIDMFMRENYIFTKTKLTNKVLGDDIHIEMRLNKVSASAFTRTMLKSYKDNLVYYYNREINFNSININELDTIKDKEQKELREDFLNWLKQYNITIEQLNSMFDYYYQTHEIDKEIAI